jgi:phenylalanyl-tRNA synthetase alpha chain
MDINTNESSLSFESIIEHARLACAECIDNIGLDTQKSKFLGKVGIITSLLKELYTLTAEQKKIQGAEINKLKKNIELIFEQKKISIDSIELEHKLSSEKIDVSLSRHNIYSGNLHPVMRTQERIEDIFASLGFSIAQGPEIENDWFNFSALNSPKNHPARSMQDTFYIEDLDEQKNPLLLRTHTSPIQVRYATNHAQKYSTHETMPDIRIIAPGRTYRVDSDATHSPMFNQVEALWVGQNISFCDLKNIYTSFLKIFFETDDIQVRFRPSYFPFTEPSAEIDMSFASYNKDGADINQKWLEISGAGQVHPNVLSNMGIDSNKYMGFAFGSGLERLTMLKYGINDLRLFFEGDIRFLRQF